MEAAKVEEVLVVAMLASELERARASQQRDVFEVCILSIYAYVYEYIYIHIYVYIYIYIYVYTYIDTFISVYMYFYVCTYVSIHMCAPCSSAMFLRCAYDIIYMYVYMYMYVYIYVSVCTYEIYMCICKHTRT